MKLVNVLKTFYYLRMVLMTFEERALLPEVVKFVAKKSMTMQNPTTFNKNFFVYAYGFNNVYNGRFNKF